MSDYRVNLDIFSGPMDLLLYLVRKEEVDIYDISIARITDEYIRYVEMLKQLDIDLAGDFLVMAATLMEIKSAMLLPRVEIEQIEDSDSADPRAELIRQLLEYKKFKDAANMLSDAAQQQNLRFNRPDTIIDTLKPAREAEMDIEQVSVWDLLRAFNDLMRATGKLADLGHIADDTPIDLYEIDILDRLQKDGPMSFERLFVGDKNRLVLVGMFLALLELIRAKLIWVEQPAPFAPIYIRALTDEPAEQAVQKAILASDQQGQPAQPRTGAIPIRELPSRAASPQDSPTYQTIDNRQKAVFDTDEIQPN
ncbi:MAG: segregation/condensation protein A [Planctomycetota bacterium]